MPCARVTAISASVRTAGGCPWRCTHRRTDAASRVCPRIRTAPYARARARCNAAVALPLPLRTESNRITHHTPYRALRRHYTAPRHMHCIRSALHCATRCYESNHSPDRKQSARVRRGAVATATAVRLWALACVWHSVTFSSSRVFVFVFVFVLSAVSRAADATDC